MRILVATAVLASLLSCRPALAQLFSGKNAVFSREVWQTAEGILPWRMLSPTGKAQFPLYRTVWKRADADFLVCLRYPGMEMFGTPYDVAIVNTNMQIIRHGEITAYQNDTPYCVAEVMANDEQLPEELRNKWLFAVGFWERHFQQRMRLVREGGATNPPANVNAILAMLPSEFYFELVRWDDDPVKPKYGAGNLLDIPKLKIRWIERGSSILSRATQSLKKPYRFEMPKAALQAESRTAALGGVTPPHASAEGPRSGLINDPPTSHVLKRREVTLTKQQPSDSFLGAQLVEVAADGTTTIEVLKTKNKLSARIGEYFVSPEYGQKGLRVVSASSKHPEVRLLRTWCD